MKNKITFTLLCFGILLADKCLSQFGPQNVVDTTISTISEIITCDVNNDSRQDIVVSRAPGSNDKIAFYLNQGNGTFGSQQIAASNLNLVRTLASGDFDGDGWEDIVTGSGFSIYIIMNNAGTYMPMVHIDSLQGPIDFKVADIDNDNDLDILVAGDLELKVLYNDGAANFTSQTVASPITENYALCLKDLNGDSFKEAIVGGVTTLIYQNNNGVLSFDSLGTASINNFGLVFLVHSEDFDGDGSNDLLIGGDNHSDLRWYKNNGSGIFSLQQIVDTIGTCHSVRSHDFDLDGDNDILIPLEQAGEIVWYENSGSGVFLQKNVIHVGNSGSTKVVHSEDLNNDNRFDVIWSSRLSFHLNNFVTSISTNSPTDLIHLYPNPFQNSIYIDSNESGTLSITDLSGNIMKSEYKLEIGLNHLPLNLTKGCYIIHIKTEKINTYNKIIKL